MPLILLYLYASVCILYAEGTGKRMIPTIEREKILYIKQNGLKYVG